MSTTIHPEPTPTVASDQRPENAGSSPTVPATEGTSLTEEDRLVEEDLLVEDVSIDGMCGVY